MRFSKTIITVSATLISAALAAFENPIAQPDASANLVAGEAFEIKWTPTTEGPITLLLKAGPSGNLNTVGTIVENAPNTGSFIWSVPSILVAGTDYAIEIRALGGAEVNYTPQFGVESTVSASSSAIGSSSITSTSTTTVTSAPPSSSSISEAHSSEGHSSTEDVTATIGMSLSSSGMTTSTTLKVVPTVSINATFTGNATSSKPTLAISEGAAGGLAVKAGLLVAAAAVAVAVSL